MLLAIVLSANDTKKKNCVLNPMVQDYEGRSLTTTRLSPGTRNEQE